MGNINSIFNKNCNILYLRCFLEISKIVGRGLENKMIDMIDRPDAKTDDRICKLEVLCENMDLYMPKLEFFEYLDELRRVKKRLAGCD